MGRDQDSGTRLGLQSGYDSVPVAPTKNGDVVRKECAGDGVPTIVGPMGEPRDGLQEGADERGGRLGLATEITHALGC